MSSSLTNKEFLIIKPARNVLQLLTWESIVFDVQNSAWHPPVLFSNLIFSNKIISMAIDSWRKIPDFLPMIYSSGRIEQKLRSLRDKSFLIDWGISDWLKGVLYWLAHDTAMLIWNNRMIPPRPPPINTQRTFHKSEISHCLRLATLSFTARRARADEWELVVCIKV